MLARLARQEHAARLAAEEAQKQGMRVTARFAARTVVREVALRWAALEGAAADPELRGLLRGVQDPGPLRPRPDLEDWLRRQHTEHFLTTRATSWFLTDAQGRQIARHPPAAKLVGRNFAFRDYFHGKGEDRPQSARGAGPLTDVHCSVVYESQAIGRRLVAFSAPVWGEKRAPAGKGPIAVLSMTVELGHFGVLQASLSKDQIAVLVDTRHDWVDGKGPKGLILHHPHLAELSRDPGLQKLPVFRLDPARVEWLQRLRRQALEHERREAQRPSDQQPAAEEGEVSDTLETNYRDPIGGAYRGPWLAAFEPVVIRRRAGAVKDIGWVVIVQERRGGAQTEAEDR
jgi:hypothetical protein